MYIVLLSPAIFLFGRNEYNYVVRPSKAIKFAAKSTYKKKKKLGTFCTMMFNAYDWTGSFNKQIM